MVAPCFYVHGSALQKKIVPKNVTLRLYNVAVMLRCRAGTLASNEQTVNP